MVSVVGKFGLPLDANPRLDLEDLYRRYEIDREGAERLADRLLACSVRDSRLRLLNGGHYRNTTVVEVLLDRSRGQMSTHLPRALEIAQLARAHANRVLPEFADRAIAADFQAVVHSALGHIYRRLFRLRKARRALDEAERLLRHYTGSVRVAATFLTSKALYLADARKPAQALKYLDDTLELYQAVEDRHRTGESLLNQGMVLFNAGRPDEAIQKAQRARSYLDITHHPRWGFVLLQNLALYYGASGELDLAHDYLNDAQRIPHYPLPPHDRLRVAWVRARLLVVAGRTREALSLFSEIRHAFLAEGLPYEAALSSLDLAEELARSGRHRLLRRLSQELIDFFRTTPLPEEALAALVLLGSARTSTAIEAIVQKIKILQARRPVLLAG